MGPTYRTAISFGHDFPPLQVKFNFVMAAFGYLTNLEVLLSIWLFHILSLIEIGALNRFGITVGKDFGSGLLLQQVGGFIAFALFGLFMARQHIGTVIRALWQPDAQDKTELLSYRTAVIGLSISLIYASAWMYALGISLLGITVQLGLLLIYFIGLAKIVAETGLVYVETPLRTQELAAAALGTNVQTPDHVGMALSANSVESHREYILPSLTHTAKIHDVFRWPRNRMVAALMLAFIIGFAVSIIYTLNLCYGATGAANIRHVFVFGGYSQRMFDRVVSWASEPTSFGRVEWQFLAAGALGTLFLSLMRLRFAWWPLHPVGFTVGYVYPVRGYRLHRLPRLGIQIHRIAHRWHSALPQFATLLHRPLNRLHPRRWPFHTRRSHLLPRQRPHGAFLVSYINKHQKGSSPRDDDQNLLDRG